MKTNEYCKLSGVGVVSTNPHKVWILGSIPNTATMIEIYDSVDKLPFDTDKDIVWYFAHNEDCFTVYDTTQHVYTKNCDLLRFDAIFVVYKKSRFQLQMV